MKQNICRISCLVTLVVELTWINMGHSMHRDAGSMVSAVTHECVGRELLELIYNVDLA